MKKIYLTILSTTILLTSCAGKGDSAKKEIVVSPQSSYAKCLANAPAWVLNENVEGAPLSAVGSAKIGKAGFQFAIEEAETVARDKLARMIVVKVKNMTKRFVQSVGTGDTETVDRIVTNVSKQVSYATLSGVRTVRKWISPCNEIYVLVAVDPDFIKQRVKQVMLSSFKNEQALWQMFQAKKAQEELDKEIEKEFKGGQ